MIAQLDTLYIRRRPGKAVNRLVSYGLFEGRPVTTKGRWVNPFLRRFLRAVARVPQLRHVERPIFILGTGRSGTTILGRVLSMHRDVGFLNEPKLLWHTICPFEDVVGNYTLDEAFYRLGREHASPETVRTACRLMGNYLALVGSRRLVDKYPELIFRVPFVKTLFPDAQFIFLVRNGIDVHSSIETWSARHGIRDRSAIHDWWGVNNRKWHLLVQQVIAADPALAAHCTEIEAMTNQRHRAAVEWIVTMREGMEAVNRFPGDIYTLHYEALTADPRRQLTDLSTFCGLRPDETFLAYAAAVLKPAKRHPRTELPPALEPLFQETMAKLGYEY